MTSQSSNKGNTQVLWVQVCSLAAVQGAITLLWVIYNLYLVDLLSRLGFPTALATGLLVVENILAIVMEPLMGNLSDRLQRQLGTQFPLISMGVILAAGTSVCLPVLALGGLGATFRWVLPAMLVAWALAMTVFRSPALSLLGRYAFNTQLPQAASILTLVGGVASAMGPLASEVLLGWGPVLTFAIGSGVLLVATAALRAFNPGARVTTEVPDQSDAIAPQPSIAWGSLGLVFGAGVGVTLGFRLLMTLFSGVLNNQVPDANVGIVMGNVFISLAITAIPSGALAVRLGNRRAMVIGLAGMSLVCVLVGGVQQNFIAIILAWLFGATLSLVSNGTIPFALSMVPLPKAGLGTGMFFSGGAAAAALFGAIAGKIQTMPPSLGALLGVIAFLIAGICVASAPRRVATASL